MASEGKFYWLLGGQDVEKGIPKMSTTNLGTGRCLEMRFFHLIIIIAEDINFGINRNIGIAEDIEYGKNDCNLSKRFVCSFPSTCIVQNGTAT